jgi:transglutaminase-like putative cysteine protease
VSSRSSYAPPYAADYTQPRRFRSRNDEALLTSLALRFVRRCLAINALILCSALPEVPLVFTLALIFLCLVEVIIPAPRFCREPEFQDAIAYISYGALPIFLVIYLSLGSANPLLDALLSFLILFHVKWVYSPRNDFHWLASLLLYALVAIRMNNLLFGVAFLSFLVFSMIYLVGIQELGTGVRSRRRFLASLHHRRAVRHRILFWFIPLGVLGIALFYLMPRFPPMRGWGGSGNYTNVTDSIDLGTPGPLSLDPKVVAYMTLEGESGELVDRRTLYLRTGHLDAILPENWTFYRIDQNFGTSPKWVPGERRRASIGPITYYQMDRPLKQDISGTKNIYFKLELRDPEVSFAALPLGSYSLQVPLPGSYRPVGSDFMVLDYLMPPYKMAGRAYYPEIDADIKAAGWPVFPQLEPKPLGFYERRFLTRLPPELRVADIRQLALSWYREAQTANEQEMAAFVAAKFRRGSRYRYRLDPTQDSYSDNPIRDFLTIPKYGEGYCEMFAASTVVILRHLAIPARVAVGFTGSEYDLERNRYVVRRSNAHAWVEFYDKEKGWMSIDPTPEQVFQSYQNRITFKLLKDWTDNLRRYWRDTIVNFDHVRQGGIYKSGRDRVVKGWDNLKEWFGRFGHQLGWFWQHLNRHPELRALFYLFLLLQALLIAWYLLKWAGKYSKQQRIAQQGEIAASLFWRSVEKTFQRRGYKRLASESPRLFLGRMVDRTTITPALARQLCSYYEDIQYRKTTRSSTVEQQLLRKLKH